LGSSRLRIDRTWKRLHEPVKKRRNLRIGFSRTSGDAGTEPELIEDGERFILRLFA
jgi:hypothetical protein